MRNLLKSSAGFVVLIVVGLILAAAGTATAAKLITGDDIKDGTITSADIKNGTIQGKDIKKGTIAEKRLSDEVKAKLNSGGPQGATGPKGDQGAPAPGGFIVKDGDGNTVDGIVSVGPYDWSFFWREVDGALWQYAWDGTLSSATIYYTGEDCTGNPLQLWTGSSISPNPQRRVYGNAQGFRFGSKPPTVITWASSFDGGCQNVYPPYTSHKMVELVPVQAPPKLKGPLTVYANP